MNAILNRIESMIVRDRMPHALLFVGDSGEPMMETAFALAQDLICPTPAASIACRACSACLRVKALTHPDLQILEAEKKEIKIEQVRVFQKWLWIAPHEAPRKVGILKEAELLNTASSNALLKTLEEPPAHALQIITARSAESILPTLRSRVQVIRFPYSDGSDSNDETSEEAWVSTLRTFLTRPETRTSKSVFGLTEQIAKDRTQLRVFFEMVEKHLATRLREAARQPDDPRRRAWEEIFSQTQKLEYELLNRYPNVALALDQFLLNWPREAPIL